MTNTELPLGGVATELPPDTPLPTDTPPIDESLDSLHVPDNAQELLDVHTGDNVLDITAPADRGQPDTPIAEASGGQYPPDETGSRAIGRVSMSDVNVPVDEGSEQPGDRDVPPPIEPPDEPPVPGGESDESDDGSGDDPAAQRRAAEADLALYGPIQLSTGEIVGKDVGVVRIGGGEAVPTPRHGDFRPPDTEPADPVIFNELEAEAQQPPETEAPEPAEDANPATEMPVEQAEPADTPEVPHEELDRIQQAESVRYWVGKITQHTQRMVTAAGAGASDEDIDRIRLARRAAEVQLGRAIAGELAPRYQPHAPALLRRVIRGLEEL